MPPVEMQASAPDVMAEGPADSARPRGFRPLGGIGGRAAAATLRPFTDLAFDELEQLLATMLESEHVQRGLRRALEGDGARQLVDDFFDSGVFDHFVERLLASPELWHLVDEVAASPAVTVAISQQGLGFADQVAGEIRRRSRRADDLLERTAQRIVPRRFRR
jgi:hypothetical protein